MLFFERDHKNRASDDIGPVSEIAVESSPCMEPSRWRLRKGINVDDEPVRLVLDIFSSVEWHTFERQERQILIWASIPPCRDGNPG